MPIPDYQSIMLPFLKFLSDDREHSLSETIVHISSTFGLTEKDRQELLASGQQRVIDNRVGWARTYLKKAGLIESAKRGHFKITHDGHDVIKENPRTIDAKYLMRFPQFVEFRAIKRIKHTDEVGSEIEEHTPEEVIESGYGRIRDELSQDLLKTIKDCSPEFFEKLVIQLLIKMGYGGSVKDAGKAIGKSGDGGIDGIIKEDKLGLDVIYVQAKRWEGSVGRPEIHKFAGALQEHHAKKGIFITTSTYTKDALDSVTRMDTKVVLIGGGQLAEYLIDYNIGVLSVRSYEIKRIDSGFFEEAST